MFTRTPPPSVVDTNVRHQEYSHSESMQHQHSRNWDAFSTTHQLWAAAVWFSCFKATVIWNMCTVCSTAYRVPNITILLSATLNKKCYVNTCTITTCYNATCFKILYDTVQYLFLWTSMAHTYIPDTCHSLVIRISDVHHWIHETMEDVFKCNRCKHNWKLIFFETI